MGAVRIGRFLGLEAAVQGSTIFVDQYELAVEQACSGLNSTISLIAVGVVYARWYHRARPSRLLALVTLSIPIALFANLLRVTVLMAAVHGFGSSILATPLHPISGAMSFAFALLLAIAFDAVLGRGWMTSR